MSDCPVTEISTSFFQDTVLEVSYKVLDSIGTLVIPTSIYYSLKDIDGNIINNIDEVSLPLSSIGTITLKDDDLSLTSIEQSQGWAYRYLIIEGTYNKGSETGLPFKSVVKFKLCALIT